MKNLRTVQELIDDLSEMPRDAIAEFSAKPSTDPNEIENSAPYTLKQDARTNRVEIEILWGTAGVH